MECDDCHLWKNKENGGTFNDESYQIDHKEERYINGNDNDDNLQALCVACRAIKTKRFMLNRNPNKNTTNRIMIWKKHLLS